MTHQKLTKTLVNKIAIPEPMPNGKPKHVFYRCSALPGFGLRVTSGGAKSFIVEKRINGKVKRLTIGKYGLLTVEKARIKAMELLGDITLGKDPVAEKRAIDARGVTLSQAFESYLTTRKDLKPGTIKNYQTCVNGCLGDWKSKRLIDINKNLVEERHREIGQRAPARANNTMRVLRAIFNHAMEKYEDADGKPFISINPVLRLSRNRAWYRIERRTGMIKPHQLAAWFAATEQLHQDTARDYLQFLLFTGLRKMEAASLAWSDIDLTGRTFTVADTKNRKPHTLPLPDFLHKLLRQRFEDSTSPWVFPGRTDTGHLKEPRTAVTRVKELSGIEFTLHDLRRTFITVAESLDISAYALKRLANHHMANDITAGYIISDVERLRDPMNRIAGFIQLQITIKED